MVQSIFILLFGLIPHGGAVDVVAGAAQAFHAAYTLGGCESVDEGAAAEALERIRSCETRGQTSAFAAMAKIPGRVLAPAEDQFFLAVAAQHARELGCAADFGDTIAGDRKLLDGVIAKFRILRDSRRTWLRGLADKKADRVITGRTCPNSTRELDEAHDTVQFVKLCRDVIVAKATFDSVRASLPLGETAIAKKAADAYANGVVDLSDDELRETTAKYLKDAAADLKSQSARLRSRSADPSMTVFNAAEKAELISDPAVVNAVTSAEPKMMKPIACLADARYGRGRTNLVTTLNIGTALFAGGAFAVGKGVGLLAGSAAAGRLSTTAVRVLQIGAASATTGTLAVDADKLCRRVDLKNKSAGGACVSAPKIEQIDSDNCVLSAALAGLDATTVVPSAKLAMFALPAFISKRIRPAASAMGEARAGGTSVRSLGERGAGLDSPKYRAGTQPEIYTEEYNEMRDRFAAYNRLAPDAKVQRNFEIYSKMPDAETLPPVAPGLAKYVDQVKQKLGREPMLKHEAADSFFQITERAPMLVAVDPQTGQRLGGIMYTRREDQLYIDLMRNQAKESGLGGYLFNQALARNPGVKTLGAELGYDNAAAVTKEMRNLQDSGLEPGDICRRALMASSFYKIAARAGYSSIQNPNCAAKNGNYKIVISRP